MFKPIITRAPGLPLDTNEIPFHIQLGPNDIADSYRVFMTGECAQQLQQYIDKVHPQPDRGNFDQDYEARPGFFENKDSNE